MTTDLSFTTNTLPTFQYEPFSYRISNVPAGTTRLTIPVYTVPLEFLTISGSNSVTFATTNNTLPAGTQTFTVVASDASTSVVYGTSTNTVTIGAGRFRDSLSNSISGSNYVFYKNEPITPIRIRAPFAVSLPTASPILPPGLVFSQIDVSTYDIIGTPTVTVPQSNYLFLGKGLTSNLGKIITSSNVGMIVNAERMLLDLSGSPIVSNMLIDSPIATRVITARFPPYTSTTSLTYSWSPLPDGIVVKNNAGVVQAGSSFNATDASYTLVLEGTPTLAAAQAFQFANITSNVVNIVATRTGTLLSSNVPFTFQFGPTVLFTANVIRPILYKNLRVDPLSNYFAAQTYFPDGSGNDAIANIFATTTLPTDLSLSFNSVLARSDLSGIPTVSGSGSYTIRAINSNGIFRDLATTINVSNDSVSFSSPTDVCYNFIEARPLSNALTGYYPSPIVFRATAASESPLTFTATGLPSGIDLSYSSPTSATLVGSTTDITALTTMRVTATAPTDASGTRDVSYAVLADTITFNPVASSNLSFIQNREIAQFQFTATALSERPVISFTSSNMPSGVSLTTIGFVTGTPTGDTSGSFSVLASTGFTSKTQSFAYNLLPDRMLLIADPTVSTYDPGANVSIDMNGVSYSGKTVSNYTFSNFTQSYGLSIDPATGMITGTLSDSLPPNPLLPTLCNFSVNAVAGSLDSSLGGVLGTGNPIVFRSFLFNTNESSGFSRLYTDDTSGLSAWKESTPAGNKWITDFQIKNTTLDSNTFLICDSGNIGTPGVLRSTDGVNFTSIPFGGASSNRPYKAVNFSNTSAWYVAGTTVTTSNQVGFYTSTDDALTWIGPKELSMVPRQNQNFTNYYTYQGLAFGYSNNIFMIGGGSNGVDATILRSDDTGSNWSGVSGGFTTEVGNFSMDGPVWVATGSDGYSSGTRYNGTFDISSSTLKWSSNQGRDWNDASGTVCDFIGYEVAYASNTWLSTGMDRDGTTSTIVSKLLCSTDGIEWSNVSLSGITFTAFGENHLPEVGSPWFDGSNWNVLVKLDAPAYDCKIYTHDLTPPFTSGWTQRVSAVSPFNGVAGPQPRGFWQQYVRTGRPTRATFTFDSFPPGGPVVTSPTTTSFTFYQYVTITPIMVSVTATGFVYFFLENATLPLGIVFDPLTGMITGQSVELGQKSFTIYMKDDIGVTALTITTNTIVPRVIRQQTSAGAWTSMIRQYTTVNAAQNSVNGHVLPATEATLGEFMRPEPPDSVSATGNPNCTKC